MIKRMFDMVIACFGIVFLAPLFALIAVLIMISSPGPIFYRGQRVGRNGVPFKIFKFRTMVVNAEKLGGPCTASCDPRITGVGKTLRKYKIDELPQVFNILLGQMSLVGPRPEVSAYISKLSGDDRKILELRPGMTDWASIWNFCEGEFLEGFEDPAEAYESIILPTKVKLQMKYHCNHTIVIDLKIIIFTIVKLLHLPWAPKELKPYPCLKPRLHTLGDLSSIEVSQQKSFAIQHRLLEQRLRDGSDGFVKPVEGKHTHCENS